MVYKIRLIVVNTKKDMFIVMIVLSIYYGKHTRLFNVNEVNHEFMKTFIRDLSPTFHDAIIFEVKTNRFIK